MNRKHLMLLSLVCLLPACSSFQKDDAPNYAAQEKAPAKVRPASERAKTLTSLGIAYYQLGKYGDALEKLKHSLKLDEKNAITYQTLALIQMKKNHPEQARAFFLKAIELSPEDNNILTDYAVFLYENGEKEQAITEFKRVIETPFYQSKWTAFTYLGVVDLQHNKQRDAEKNFYNALKNNPNYAPALFEMAKIRYAKADMMSARGFIERYFAHAGKSLEGLILAIKIETGLGDDDVVAQYQLELTRAYPFSDAAEKIKHNNTVTQ